MSKKDERIVQREERPEPESRKPAEAKADPIRADTLRPSPEELTNLLRQEALANALPSPPKIAGWHLIWLSTTNTYTPIQQYARLGYVPVRPEEVPEWAYLKQHGAQHGGDEISCNEMVLYKIPEDAYQQIMRVIHHERPNEESERLRANIEQLKEGGEFRDSQGQALVREEGDGFASVLDRKVRSENFE